MKSSSKFSSLIRWALAGGLLYWAISRGQIDLKVLAKLFENPLLFFGLLALVYLQLFGTIVRWIFLLKSQQISIPLWTAIRLCMSAQFFQLFGPGTIGADVAKVVYITSHAPHRKAGGLSTVLVDRVMGFFGMLFLGSASFVLSLQHLESSTHKFMPGLLKVGFGISAATFAIVFGLLFLPFLVRIIRSLKMRMGFNWFFEKALVRQFVEIIELYCERRNYLWYGIFISTAMHVVGVCILYALSAQLFGGIMDLALSEFFLGASLGVLVTALPLAPSGIGVGQLAFANVFLALGWANETFGGSLITAFQVLLILTNLSGFFFVASRKKKIEKRA